uniref:Protein kinase domain-containing protein n=1 Tax=Nicotiana tabacum TaxID=4097 RepID=A0A1S3YJR5_TOBAC|nr:PREDICTED: uncharacterized protein LOC107777028 [Nicotiana tabacum]
MKVTLQQVLGLIVRYPVRAILLQNLTPTHGVIVKLSPSKFSIEAVTVGGVSLCSYSELLKITDFKTGNFLQKTLSGRLFCGAIGEGSEKRLVIVKTWDVLLPYRGDLAQSLPKFCDEIKLFTDKTANTHPNLAKLCTFCCDTRLAAVYEYDEKCTGVLSDVLLDDKFGWSNRIKVAAQLANLLAWLHEKGIAVGCVTASCIMIDEVEFQPLVVWPTFYFS